MNVTPDDPRLSAYLLGELSPEDSLQIERAAAADPAIGMSLEELKKMTGFLDEVFGCSGCEGLMAPQREAIRRASRNADSPGEIVELASAKHGMKAWTGGVAAAAAVVIAALLLSRVDDDRSHSADVMGTVSGEVALLPLPGPNSGGGTSVVAGNREPLNEQQRALEDRPGEFLREVSRQLGRNPLPLESRLPPTSDLTGFVGKSEIRLPVIVGTSSLRWVDGWIRDRRQLPPRNAVRIEELINSASLAGGDEYGGLHVTLETMKCPWNSRSMLAAVQVEAIANSVHDLKLALHSKTECRVLGSFPIREGRSLPDILPAGRRTLVMVELSGSMEISGKLEIHQGDQVYSLTLPDPRIEVSPGMRHAAALAGFGMWLRQEGVSAGELRNVLDSFGSDPDTVRVEVRQMMEAALELAHPKR